MFTTISFSLMLIFGAIKLTSAHLMSQGYKNISSSYLPFSCNGSYTDRHPFTNSSISTLATLSASDVESSNWTTVTLTMFTTISPSTVSTTHSYLSSNTSTSTIFSSLPSGTLSEQSSAVNTSLTWQPDFTTSKTVDTTSRVITSPSSSRNTTVHPTQPAIITTSYPPKSTKGTESTIPVTTTPHCTTCSGHSYSDGKSTTQGGVTSYGLTTSTKCIYGPLHLAFECPSGKSGGPTTLHTIFTS